jgi:3-isopropylmalate/(R)-2-methylmalate dehydratase small subunit
MRPFTTHTGTSAPLLRDNIDTDQIIPSREMKTVSKTGLSDGLFAGQRYIEGRTPNPNFVLNQDSYRNASILLSGQNFGCGSSREHAVWSLKEYGFRAIIAESFGEIFYNNCVRNGLLCVQFSSSQIANLGREVTIDLKAQTVNGSKFDILDGDKAMLMGGLDPISLTLQDQTDIERHVAQDRRQRPWVY